MNSLTNHRVFFTNCFIVLSFNLNHKLSFLNYYILHKLYKKIILSTDFIKLSYESLSCTPINTKLYRNYIYSYLFTLIT